MTRRRIPADDLPYGPGNPDYEYDAWRQRQDDEAEGHRARQFMLGAALGVLVYVATVVLFSLGVK